MWPLTTGPLGAADSAGAGAGDNEVTTRVDVCVWGETCCVADVAVELNVGILGSVLAVGAAELELTVLVGGAVSGPEVGRVGIVGSGGICCVFEVVFCIPALIAVFCG